MGCEERDVGLQFPALAVEEAALAVEKMVVHSE
jgi:hypothetical protein